MTSNDLGRNEGRSDDLADLGLCLCLRLRLGDAALDNTVLEDVVLDGHGGRDNWRGRDCGVDADTWVLLDNRVEAVHGVGCVGDDTPGAVGLDQTVAALDNVAVARFLLSLVIT